MGLRWAALPASSAQNRIPELRRIIGEPVL
jgi:hypothetical protein